MRNGCCGTSAAASSPRSRTRRCRGLGITARLPRRLDGLATRLENGEIAVETPRLDRQIRLLERAVSRMASAVLFFGLLLGGVLMRSTDAVRGSC